MRVLICGARGFLGSTIAEHFAAGGSEVYGIGRNAFPALPPAFAGWWTMNLPDQHLLDVLRDLRPDAVVHAASPATVGWSIENPYGDFRGSVGVWAGLLEAMRQSGVRSRVVLLSSAAVYGNPASLPVDETVPPAPISPYGYHKHMCEQIAEYYVRLFDLTICSLRIFSAYGVGLKRQVIWDICRKLHASPTIELSGTGEESRDFIHASDVAQAVSCVIARAPFRAEVYNVAGGQATTIAELAGRLAALFGPEHRVRFSGQRRPGDPLSWQADIERISALGFRASASLAEGLRAYVAWAKREPELA